MNETTSNPDTPSNPASDHTPDAVVSATPLADATPPADPTPPTYTAPTHTAPSYTPPPTYTPPAAAPPAASTRQPVRLRRSRDERMIAGVCGGLAATLGVDVVILRLALVLATVLGVGAGVILYVACWILMPQAPEAIAAPDAEATTDLLPVAS
jgi:phage shock protein PspC (stress-responsive transcriptional regulator)